MNSDDKMQFKICERDIGESNKVFIVAELSANHNQDFELAAKTIEAAKKSGADAVKIQTYTPDTMTLNCDNEYFQIDSGTIWDGKTLYQLYQEAQTPWEWQPRLKEIAEDLDIIFFSTPFDYTAVDFLESMNVPAYKIASFEITDLPLIEYVASKGKPIIISTGIANVSDISDAIKACRNVGNNQIALLKCSSSYPAPPEDLNLKSIQYMIKEFNTVVGFSDHTLGINSAIVAVALGAEIIEKHLILDKNLSSLDSEFSCEPAEFNKLVKSVRNVEKSIGTFEYQFTPEMEKNREFGRSLFAIKDIKKGDILSEHNIKSIRPGYGIHPKYLKDIIGKNALKDIKKGTPLNWDLF